MLDLPNFTPPETPDNFPSERYNEGIEMKNYVVNHPKFDPNKPVLIVMTLTNGTVIAQQGTVRDIVQLANIEKR